MLYLCICTHNPRLPILQRCLEAIETQVSPPLFRILLVDNASQPPLNDSLLDGLRQRGVSAVLIREQRLGLTAARLAAFQQTSGEWLVFIDDDNVVAPNFLQLGTEFARAHPEVGAFGGRISLAPEIKTPQWMAPLLCSMGVKEEGDKILINSTIDWGPHDPPGAGLWVRRVLLERFADRARANPAVYNLGRRGNGLGSNEDALIVKGAPDLGLYNAYVPSLRVMHYLKAERFTFWHAIQSFIGYGKSIALYEQIMALRGDQLATVDKPGPLLAGWKAFNRERHRSVRYAATQAVYQCVYERTRRALGCRELDIDGEALPALRNLIPFLRTGASAHADRGGIGVTEGTEEFAVYGPYWTLPAGHYEMRAVIKPDQQTYNDACVVTAQVTADLGTRLFAEGKWRLYQYRFRNPSTKPVEYRLPFSLSSKLPPAARTIETRIITPGNASFRIHSLSVIVKSGSPESDWFPYLTVGDCGIHTGAEIASMKGITGCIACTPSMAIIPGQYELAVDISIEPRHQNSVLFELWSGARLIASQAVKYGSNQLLRFDVTVELCGKGIELRISAVEATNCLIRGVIVKKVRDDVAPTWQAGDHYSMPLEKLSSGTNNFTPLLKLGSITAKLIRRIRGR